MHSNLTFRRKAVATTTETTESGYSLVETIVAAAILTSVFLPLAVILTNPHPSPIDQSRALDLARLHLESASWNPPSSSLFDVQNENPGNNLRLPVGLHTADSENVSTITATVLSRDSSHTLVQLSSKKFIHPNP